MSIQAFSIPPETNKTTDFYFVGVPKCGTHLLQKVIFYLNDQTFKGCEPFLHPNNLVEDLFFMETNPKKKFIIIVRDPRDALLSALEFVRMGPVDHDKKPRDKDFWHLPLRVNPRYLNMTDNERLTHMVRMDDQNLLIGSEKIHTSYAVAMLAESLPNVKVVRFEDLVGSKGGGDDKIKRDVLEEIATFLNLSKKNIDLAFEKTWGPENQHGWKTFRQGIIGRWRSVYESDLISDIKNYGSWNEILLHYGYENNSDW